MGEVVDFKIPYAVKKTVVVVLAYDSDGFSGIYCWHEADKQYVKMNPVGFDFNSVLSLAEYIKQSRDAFGKLNHKVEFRITDINSLKYYNWG